MLLCPPSYTLRLVSEKASKTASRFRLIALDVDGTLLNPQGHVSPRTARAIREAMARGVLVVVCTRRAFSSGVQQLARELGLSLPAIVRNGNAIQDTATGEVLMYRAIPAVAMQAALDTILEGETAPVVEQGPVHGEALFTLAERAGDPALVQVTREWARAGHLRFVDAEALYAIPEPTWIGAYGTGEATRRVYQVLRGIAGVSTYWTGELIEREYHFTGVQPAESTKATALQLFAAERGIALSEVMAVGDYYNDVEMLREVGWGVAMGHAPDYVKGFADAVVPDNAHDGAAVAIERYVLAGETNPA